MAARLRGVSRLALRVSARQPWPLAALQGSAPLAAEEGAVLGFGTEEKSAAFAGEWRRSFSSSAISSNIHVGSGSGGRVGGVTVRGPPEDLPFAVKGLNHIAIAVPDLEAAAEHYRTVFGAHVSDPLPQPAHGVTVAFVRVANFCIELLHPLGDNSPIAGFLEKNPRGGLHHLCLTVDDIEAAMVHVKEKGLQTLSPHPKLGAHQHPVIFLNPKSNHGVLCELEEVRTHYEAEKDEKEATA